MLKTHKEIFSDYLSDAHREYNEIHGEMAMEDWEEWLFRHDIIRCSMTGLYGRSGHDVHYLYDYDQPVRVDGDYPIRFLAQMKGFKLEWDRENEQEVIRVIVDDEKNTDLFEVGEVFYSFCDTEFASKEKRVETWLKARDDA